MRNQLRVHMSVDFTVHTEEKGGCDAIMIKAPEDFLKLKDGDFQKLSFPGKMNVFRSKSLLDSNEKGALLPNLIEQLDLLETDLLDLSRDSDMM